MLVLQTGRMVGSELPEEGQVMWGGEHCLSGGCSKESFIIDVTRKPPISLSILRVTFFSFCFCHDSSSTQLMPGKQLMMGMFPRGISQPTLCLLEARMLLPRPLSKLPFPISAGIWCQEGGKLSSFSPKSGNRCDGVNTDDHLNCHLAKGR